MPLNRQLQNVRNEIYDAELEDVQQWTRAKVNECIVSAVIVVQRLSADNPALVEMLATWPADSSVRYEWFANLGQRPELQINPLQKPILDSMTNVRNVLTRWLDLIDSHMDRTVLILHACGVSFDKIAAMFPDRRWKHNTLRRRHGQLLEKLIYDLNHIDDLKWPKGVSFWKFK